MSANLVLGEDPFPVFSHGRKSEGALPGLFYEALVPFMRAPPHPQRPHFQTPSHCGLVFNIKHSVYGRGYLTIPMIHSRRGITASQAVTKKTVPLPPPPETC